MIKKADYTRKAELKVNLLDRRKKLNAENRELFKKAEQGDTDAQRQYSINLNKLKVVNNQLNGNFKTPEASAQPIPTQKNRYRKSYK